MAEDTEDIEKKEDIQKTEDPAQRVRGSQFTQNETDEDELEEKGLWQTLKDANINSRWFLRQTGVMIAIVIGIVCIITNRYQAQQEVIEKDTLSQRVLDYRYKAITRKSDLTEQTRQSKIQDLLRQKGDTTLLPAAEPPYTINKK